MLAPAGTAASECKLLGFSLASGEKRYRVNFLDIEGCKARTDKWDISAALCMFVCMYHLLSMS